MSPATPTTPRRPWRPRLLATADAAVKAIAGLDHAGDIVRPDQSRAELKRLARAAFRALSCWPAGRDGLGIHRFPADARPTDRCHCGDRALGTTGGTSSRARRRRRHILKAGAA